MPFPFIPEVRVNTNVEGNTCFCCIRPERDVSRARCLYDRDAGEYYPSKSSFFKNEKYKVANALAWKTCKNTVLGLYPDPDFYSDLVYEVTHLTEEQIAARDISLRHHQYLEIIDRAKKAAANAFLPPDPEHSKSRVLEFNVRIKKPDGSEKSVNYIRTVNTNSPYRAGDDIAPGSSRLAIETLQEMMRDRDAGRAQESREIQERKSEDRMIVEID